jgi:ABC-type nitrate/sulfonate/bicarbonate transport system substrate-binding protein
MVFAFLPGISAPTFATPNTVVGVGIALTPPKMVFLAPFVADAEGFFADQHIKVKFYDMPDGLETELGVANGTINLGFSSGTDPISSAAVGSPIHAIWSYSSKLDTVCIGAPGIKTPKDLIGQPVGSTGTGGFAYTQLNACVNSAGVKVEDVKPINMKRSQFVGAMAAGQIKAAVFHVDDAYTVTHAIAGTTILNNEYATVPLWWYGAVSALDSWAAKNPALVTRFLKAMLLTDRWMNNPVNKAKVIAYGIKFTQEDPAAVASAYDFIIKGGLWEQNDGMAPASVNFTASEMKRLGEIDVLPTYSQIVDTHYIKGALAQVGKVKVK